MREITQSKISAGYGLNFAAAIFKFTRLKFTDLREPPFVTDLLPS
nr:hypothetical protein [uncultured Campylobacter sp.]